MNDRVQAAVWLATAVALVLVCGDSVQLSMEVERWDAFWELVGQAWAEAHGMLLNVLVFALVLAYWDRYRDTERQGATREL